jgi:hypothetical protein
VHGACWHGEGLVSLFAAHHSFFGLRGIIVDVLPSQVPAAWL